VILDRFKLTDRVAIVTGAGKGIGRGIALAFAEAGADVVCAARTQEDIDETVKQIEQRGRRGLAVRTDVLEQSDREQLVEAAVSGLGRLDVLVNNAGGTPPRPALKTSHEFFENALRFNVVQAFELMRLAVPKILETAGRGSIVNISSRSSDMVQTSFAAYGAGKAALNMMTRNVAAEWAPKVRVNAISVGGVETEGLAVVLTNEAIRKQFEDNTPMRRPGDVEDIACMALYLASDAASWVTGKIFQVDGGTEAPAMSVPVEPL
jgi:7-alpha-hydroxysteroid dehydrogenase